jgi:hypothetical protein
MKSLRIFALMLAVGAFSIGSVPAHAQQEVDPDRFDQPTATPTHVQGSRMHSRHRMATARNMQLASKHSHRPHRLRNA